MTFITHGHVDNSSFIDRNIALRHPSKFRYLKHLSFSDSGCASKTYSYVYYLLAIVQTFHNRKSILINKKGIYFSTALA